MMIFNEKLHREPVPGIRSLNLNGCSSQSSRNVWQFQTNNSVAVAFEAELPTQRDAVKLLSVQDGH